MILKPKWHSLFMHIASAYAQMSLDPSTQVGCVIAQGKFQVSQGFNGLPAGILDTEERLNNRNEKLNLVLHAEENALFYARKEDLKGATIYVTAPPCSRCATKIIQVGIKEVFYEVASEDFMHRYKENIELTMEIFNEAGILVNEVDYVSETN